jgi:acyl carrier protein
MGNDTFKRIRSIIASDLEMASRKMMLSTSFVDDVQANSLDIFELIVIFEDASTS